MCGIYGIVGETTTNNVIESLKRLEYRGYDSCGIVYNDKSLYTMIKTIGNISNLKGKIISQKINVAIGHTRWATHGDVSIKNSHPHTSINKRFYIVHNGVIDNYKDLIKKYNFKVKTETDSEVIVHLLDVLSKKYNLIECLKKIEDLLIGSYAIVILDTKTSNLYFIKNESPLLLGIGNNKIVIASDQIAFEPKMNVTILNDYNYGYIDDNNYQIYSSNNYEKWNTFYKIENKDYCKKTDYYMLDEILEQPNVIKIISKEYNNISLDMITNEIINSKEIVFIGAGSSGYAARLLKFFYERELSKRCYSIIASEIDNFLILNKNTLFIFLSQSGETADLCFSLKKLKQEHYKVITLCNNINSTLGYKSDMVLPLFAGEEISVASTKAFLAMIYVGLIVLDKNKYLSYSISIFNDIEYALSSFNTFTNIVLNLCKAKNVFYIGKGIDYILALEGALKIREIAYINSYAFESGELKHGSIALIDENSVCIAINSNPDTYFSVMNNLSEVKTRGAKVYSLIEDSIFKIIPKLQILAFLTAKALNRNIDQPKNLAKSVTVK